MRLLSFALLAAAGFDLPVPWLDRPGAAAAGVACLALSLPKRPSRLRRPAFRRVEPVTVELPDRDEHPTFDLAGRLERYGMAARGAR